MKKLILFLFLTTIVCLVQAAPIYTWVPWYGITGSKTVLNNTYNNVLVSDVISTTALQFWNIRSDGTIHNFNVSDLKIREMVDFVKSKNMKVGMAITNIGTEETGYESFDWTIVRPAAYGPHQAFFITNILNIVDSLDIDDVNLDLEGENQQGGPWTQDDIDGYAGFVGLLADSLHARSKTLSIATYSTNTYGAPNPSWWQSWNGKVDQIHTMGYQNSYWSAPGINGYANKQAFADSVGYTGEEVLLGMPMWIDNWGGASENNVGISNVDNLHYIKNCLPSNQGVTLWDIHHPAGRFNNQGDLLWSADSVWALLQQIATDTPQDSTNCPNTDKPSWLIDDFSEIGQNFEGGLVAADSDFWGHLPVNRADSATLVYNLEKNYDMVAQMGSWGDIGYGYRQVDPTGINNILHFNVSTRATDKGESAYGGILFNTLPIDPSQDPSASAWELGKVGVDRDFSASKEIVIGARCKKDEIIHIGFESKADLIEGNHGAWRKAFTCTGNWEDYRVDWTELVEPSWGETELVFSSAEVLRISVLWINDIHPGELNIALAGIALDSSVIDYRQADLDVYKANIKITSSIDASQFELQNQVELQTTSQGWSLTGLSSDIDHSELSAYNLRGELVETVSIDSKSQTSGFWLNNLQNQNYIFQLSYNGRVLWRDIQLVN